MSKIISIGTALAAFRHRQEDILKFMQQVYALEEADNRKLRFLYHHGGIDTRYSVIPDYSRPAHEWRFYPATENMEPFPSLEHRMAWYHKYAAPLSLQAIRDCLDGCIKKEDITHLITVSCTGMSAPGLELQLMELLDLPKTTFRTSINFMGCYAAIHAIKIADAICKSEPAANVLIVCTELCTLHFQREGTMDNIASSLLFSDGSAALIISGKQQSIKGLSLESFYSEVVPQGKKDMAWELSSSGFLMTLSGYVPELIEEDFNQLAGNAFKKAGIQKQDVTRWCIHPGGKKILEAISKSMEISKEELDPSYKTLASYGNMSSPTILFVLKNILQSIKSQKTQKEIIFGAAFGPGLTMETFIASSN